MMPTLDSIFSRVVAGGLALLKMLSCLRGADEIEGRDSIVIRCGGTADLVVGLWNSAMRLLMARILPKQRVMIWFHAEPVGRSISAKMALRRAAKRWLIRASSQNAKV